MKKIKELYQKYREIIVYLVFGVMTMAVSWGIKFGILAIWKIAFNVPPEDTESTIYLTGAYIAQAISWILAVLFAFFTNRKWVFTKAEQDVSVFVQLSKFVGGRVVTGILTFLGTPLCTAAIGIFIPITASIVLLWWNLAEIIATVILEGVGVILNYIFSKIFVFKNKK